MGRFIKERATPLCFNMWYFLIGFFENGIRLRKLFSSPSVVLEHIMVNTPLLKINSEFFFSKLEWSTWFTSFEGKTAFYLLYFVRDLDLFLCGAWRCSVLKFAPTNETIHWKFPPFWLSNVLLNGKDRKKSDLFWANTKADCDWLS